MIPLGYQALIWLVICLLFGGLFASIKARHPAQFVTWLLYLAGVPFLLGVMVRLVIG